MLVFLLAIASLFTTQVEGDTTVENSYSERVENSIYSFIFGCFLFIFAVFVLIGSEKQAITFNLLIDRCQYSTVIINDLNSINPLNEDKPIFVKGQLSLDDQSHDMSSTRNIVDVDTGYRCTTKNAAIRLKRRVEMYQWVENERKEDKKTHYTYSLEWRESDISSSGFKESHTHRNPVRQPKLFSNSISHPSRVKVGAYYLAEEQINLLKRKYICTIPPSSIERSHQVAHVEQDFITTCAVPESAAGHGNSSYVNLIDWGRSQHVDFLVYNGTLRDPHVGTIRVSYEAVVEGGDVSLIGVQQQLQVESPFRPFRQSDAKAMEPWFLKLIFKIFSGDCSCNSQSSYSAANYELDSSGGSETNVPDCCLGCKVCCCCCFLLSSCAAVCSQAVVGDSLLLVEERLTTVGTMFSDERVKLRKRLNLIRFAGCFALSLSIYLIFSPIAALLSFIPFISGFLNSLFWVASLFIGFSCGGLVISFAWVLYRPLYFFILSIAFGIFFEPTDRMISLVFFFCAALSFILAVLHLVDSWLYGQAVDADRRSRPVGQLEVLGQVGSNTASSYLDLEASAPPLSLAKMKAMQIE